MQNDRLLQTFSGEKPDFGHFPDIFVRDAPFSGHYDMTFQKIELQRNSSP
jgi:hypothetical protein